MDRPSGLSALADIDLALLREVRNGTGNAQERIGVRAIIGYDHPKYGVASDFGVRRRPRVPHRDIVGFGRAGDQQPRQRRQLQHGARDRLAERRPSSKGSGAIC